MSIDVYLHVFNQRDMGTFQDVTTSTMDLGSSTLTGLATVMSLQEEKHTSIIQFPTKTFHFIKLVTLFV